ncbi:tape measure protein [Gordonibacter pamelaeae]|uniref:tape measure protein n=1 Tax=Gordonibacter pamelaeae TaxID=471189 RepID=UPI003A911880
MAEIGHAYLTLIPTFGGGGKLTKSVEGMLGKAYSNTGALSSKAGAGAASAFGGGFLKSGAIVGAAVAVTQKAVNTIASSIGGAVSRVDQMNNFPRVMQNLGYSSESAASSIQLMSDRLTGLPTSLDAMAGMVQNIAPVTGSIERATDIALAFNDALLAGGKSAELQGYAMEQYSQILAVGKVDLQAWRSIQTAMPGQLNQVSQALLGAGKNSMDLYEALKDGTVSMDEFNDAIVRLDKEGAEGFASFAQQAKDATGGIGTAWTNVKTAVTRSVANVIQAIGASGIAGAINGIGKAVGGAGNAVVSAVGLVKGAVSTMAPKFREAAEAVSTRLTPVMSGVSEAWTDAVGDMESRFAGFARLWNSGGTLLESFKLVAVNALNTVRDVAAKFVSGLADRFPAVGAVVNAAAAAFSAVSSTVGPVLGGMAAAWSDAVGDVESRMAGFASLWRSGSTPLEGFKLVAVSAFDTVRDVASRFVDGLAARFPAVRSFLDGLGATFAAVASVAAPVLSGLVEGVQRFVSALSGSVDVGVLASVASTLFSLTSPLGVVGSLVRNFGGDLQQLAQTVGASLSPILSALGQTLGGVVAGVLPGVQSAIEAMFPVVQQVVAAATNIASSVLPVLASWMQQMAPIIAQVAGFVGQLVSALDPLVASLVGSLLPVVTSIVQAVMNFVTAVMPAVMAVANVVMSAVQVVLPVLTSVISIIVSIATAVVSAVGSIVTVVVNIASVVASVVAQVVAAVSGVASVVLSVFGTIGSFISSTIATVVNVVSQGFNAALGVVGSVANAIGAYASGLFSTVARVFNSIVSTVTGAVNSAFSAAQNAFGNIVSTVSSAVGSVLDAVGSLPGKIQGFFVNAGSWLTDAGRSIVQGLIDGITGMIDAAGDAIGNVMGAIAGFLPHSPAKEGPFSGRGWSLYSGRAIVEGLGAGMAGRKAVAVAAASDVMGGIAKEMAGGSAAEMRAAQTPDLGMVRAARAYDKVDGRVINNYYTIEGIDVTGEPDIERAVKTVIDYLKRAKGVA